MATARIVTRMSVFRPGHIRWLTCMTVLLVSLWAPRGAAAFDVGFNDFDLTHYADGTAAGNAALSAGLGHAEAAGAAWWRFGLYWSAVAPTRPNDPSDPGAPEYRWAHTDTVVRALAASKLRPVLWFGNAPAWAEGPNRPAIGVLTPAGTWKPDAEAFRSFVAAVAKRYSGSYPDPANPGQLLPRIAFFQGWNEPNLYTNLTPQWERRKGGWRLESAETYRALQNAAFDGVKESQPDATVLSAGTGPYGDLQPGQNRSGPALFWRSLLCVTARGSRLTGNRACPPVKFDAWSHHPYSVGAPERKASNPDDAVVADIPKLTAILKAASRAGTVTREAVADRWVTELSWDSRPDPQGLTPAQQASYMSRAFYELWKAGVHTVLWWNSRDDARGDDWSATLQSGIFYRGSDPSKDRPKPSYAAYRFPLATDRAGKITTIWAAAPAAGQVLFQRKRAGKWIVIARPEAGVDRVVTARVTIPRRSLLRAVQGDLTSPPQRSR